MRYLFIGGSADGDWHEVSGRQQDFIIKPALSSYTGPGEKYTQRRMVTGTGGDITFYAHEKLTVHQTLEALLKGYKQP